MLTPTKNSTAMSLTNLCTTLVYKTFPFNSYKVQVKAMRECLLELSRHISENIPLSLAHIYLTSMLIYTMMYLPVEQLSQIPEVLHLQTSSTFQMGRSWNIGESLQKHATLQAGKGRESL